MTLTDFAIRAAKPREKAFKLSDGGGLHLLVNPKGKKLWRMKYRFAEKEKLLSFGPYPITALADARRKRDEAKRLLAEGTDPSAQKKRDKIAAVTAAHNTFGAIAAEYLANKAANDAAQATIEKNRWLLEDLAAPLAKRPIADITAAEVLQLLLRIEKTGHRETARRLRGAIGRIFRLAVVTLRAETDPTFALRGALQPPKVTHRPAITDEKNLGRLMRSIDGYGGWPTIAAALKFIALTCARPGEVRGTLRREIDFENGVWRIPAERTKMRRPHEVPMSRQAIAVLRDIWSHSEFGELVFPSMQSNRKLLSENALNSPYARWATARTR